MKIGLSDGSETALLAPVEMSVPKGKQFLSGLLLRVENVLHNHKASAVKRKYKEY